MSDNTQSQFGPNYVRVTRIHVHGGFNSRDIDIRDRESWKRVVRGAKDTLEQGGEHHMRPMYKDDGPAVSMPSPLKPRVEELEEGIRKAIVEIGEIGRARPVGLAIDWAIGTLEALLPEAKLAKTPAAIARATGLENEVEDAQAKTGLVP